MKRNTLIATAATVFALMGAGQAGRSHRAMHEASVATDIALDERARLESEAVAHEKRIATANTRRAALQTERDRLAATQKTSSKPPVNGPPRTRAVSPEQNVRMGQYFKAGLLLEYGPLYRALGLNAEQIEKLEALLVERNGRIGDIVATALEQGLAGSDPAISTLRRREDERVERAAVEILGAEGQRAWLDFEREARERHLVKQLVGNLAFTAAPLMADQAAHLMEILRQPDVRNPSDGSLRCDFILARAQGVLSPLQMAWLESQVSVPGGSEAIEQLTAFIDRTRAPSTRKASSAK